MHSRTEQHSISLKNKFTSAMYLKKLRVKTKKNHILNKASLSTDARHSAKR